MENPTNANPMSLEGRTIIVTGAGQGIGRAVADLVVALGGNAVIADMNPDTLSAAQAEYPEGRYLGVAANISDPADVQTLVDRAVETFGAIHGLVNNAGITRPAMIDKMSLEQWNQVINVHLTG